MSFKFTEFQLLEILKALRGVTNEYKNSETKACFPYEWLKDPEKLSNTQLPPYEAFSSKLPNKNSIEKFYSNPHSLFDAGLSSRKAIPKTKLNQPTPTGRGRPLPMFDQRVALRKLVYIQRIFSLVKQQGSHLNARSKANNDGLFRQKLIDTLKLGCCLPNLGNNFLHMSTTAKVYPFTGSNKYLLEKVLEDKVGGSSIVFTREVVVNKTLINDSSNWCKTFFGIDASQLHP